MENDKYHTILIKTVFLSLCLWSTQSYAILRCPSFSEILGKIKTPKGSAQKVLSDAEIPGDAVFKIVDGVEIDITPIQQYISSSLINKKLRTGANLTAEEEIHLTRLSRSLEALPPREANAIRKVRTDPQHMSLDDFLKTYEEGKVVEEKAYTSVGIDGQATVYGDVYQPDLVFVIRGKTMRDISDINDFEKEGIFLPGTRSRVKSVEGDVEYNDTVEIIEDDALKDHIDDASQFVSKYEDYFDAYGIGPDEFNDRFRNLQDVDFGRFKPVEGWEWEKLFAQKIRPFIKIELEEIPPATPDK